MFCKKDNLNEFILGFFILILLVMIFIPISMMPEQKNILTIIATDEDNPGVGTTNIKFSQNDIVIGNALSHENGEDTININENGVYQISYQLYGQNENLVTFKFNAVLLVNNNPLENTFNEGPILRQNTENRMTLSGTVILKLNAGDTLKLQAVTIEDINFPRARMDIEKIA